MKLSRIIKQLAFFAAIQANISASRKTDTNQVSIPEEGICQLSDKPFNPCSQYGFELIAGTPTEGTERWLIGEHHSHRDATEKCVSELVKLPGNKTLFLEGAPPEKLSPFACHLLFSIDFKSTNTTCFGLNDPHIGKDFLKDNVKSRFYAELITSKTLHEKFPHSDQQWDATYTRLSSSEKTYPNDKDPAWTKQFSKMILEERKKGRSYAEIFSFYEKNPIRMPYNANTMEMIHSRDQSLVKTLRKHTNKTIAIAVVGRDHLDTHYGSHIPGADNFVKNEMKKDSEKVSYAMLGYKRSLI